MRLLFFVSFVALLTLLQDLETPEPAVSSPGQGGFIAETLHAALPNPVAFQFAPDGRIFVATRSGDIRIIKDGNLLSDPFATVQTNTAVVRGVLGMTLDPEFADNGYVYLYYTHENNPGEPYGAKTQRLIRLTADGDVAAPGSELVLLGTTVGNLVQKSCDDFALGTDCIPADGVDHMGGGLKFAPDGSLFLSTGDAARTLSVPPPELLLRSQDLDSLAGKILRIDPATGLGFPTNPFYNGNPAANISKVWSYGFRNPFRLWIQPGTGLPIAGEVGSRLWEEVNIAKPGANYGWPCYEGTARQPDFTGNTFCDTLYETNEPVEHPAYAYANIGGAALIGGLVYDGSYFPEEFEGAYFFSDFVQQTISALQIDDDGQLVDGSVQQVLGDAGFPVDFEVGPDRRIYYLTLDPATFVGDLRVLDYVVGNRAPVARLSSNLLGGIRPFSASFSSAGSYDPDGDVLTYAWDFADGWTSTAPNPIHSFAQDGRHSVTLTVSDSNGGSTIAHQEIVVGNAPPIAEIITPLGSPGYQSGAVVAFSGGGIDPNSGALPPSGLWWTIAMKHCYVATKTCHTHPFATKNGASGTVESPSQDPSEIVYLSFSLTARDSVGLTDTIKHDIGLDSDTDGLLDFQELFTTKTDYLDSDSDDNGVLDGSEDTDGDSCADARELGPDEMSGGRRDPLNPFDYFNPTRDGRTRADDIILVVRQYFKDDRDENPGLPPYVAGYNPNSDRTITGPDTWHLGPPNGQQRIDDVLAVVRQYLQDCV